MEITDIRMRIIKNDNRLKAVATLTFDNEIAIHDIKLVESNNKLFLAMPNRKTPDGEHKDIVNPINQKTRDKLTEFILQKYESLI